MSKADSGMTSRSHEKMALLDPSQMGRVKQQSTDEYPSSFAHQQHLNYKELFPEFIGKSPKLLELLSSVQRAAATDSPALVYGESGTGKELVAAALHRLSQRSHRRFVPINCSAIPEELLESELFGHEKGAFTGASQRRIGHFEMARGGTIFLDEIGDMPPKLQVKLLRVLQEKQYTPVGSSALVKADVRVIAATNVNLEEAVEKKSFRLDLFYRLNVLPMTIPPLRERGSDIADLLEHFLEIYNHQYMSQQVRSGRCFFTSDALDLLCNYCWPGNVRELQNLVERLVIMVGGGSITPSQLPREVLRARLQSSSPRPSFNPSLRSSSEDSFSPTPSSPRFNPGNSMEPSAGELVRGGGAQTVSNEPRDREPMASAGKSELPGEPSLTQGALIPSISAQLPEGGLNLTSVIETLENSLILQALERTRNNKNQAAKLLGINRTTLVERIKKRKLVALNIPSREL